MNLKSQNMSESNEIINDSLKKVARGTGIVLVGTIIGLFLGFITRVIIIRNISQFDYGLFSLGLVIANIAVIVSTLGLQEGAARQIGFNRGKGDVKNTNRIIINSIVVALFSSIVTALLIYSFAYPLSVKLFHHSELMPILRLFAISVPFLVLFNVIIAIFRGYGRVDAKVFFNEIGRNVLYLSMLSIIFLLNKTVESVVIAYILSIVVTFIFILFYASKHRILNHKVLLNKINFDFNGLKKLLGFSLPLLLVGILNMIITWTDTIMLGIYKTAEIVGLYNGALPLANLLSLGLGSMGFIFVPIASNLYSKNQIMEIGQIYQTLTRWMFFFSVPLFMLFFIFPEVILNFLFGARYIPASNILMILSLSFIFHTLLGLNGMSLLVFGRSKLLMVSSTIGAIANIGLNFLLIPLYGAEGAALASFVSYGNMNIFNSYHLYRIAKIQPFTKNYIKLIFISIASIFLLFLLINNILFNFWSVLFIIVSIVCVNSALLFLTKSFDNADLTLLLDIVKKSGIQVIKFKNLSTMWGKK